ncbi:hypothetical protein ACIA8O_08570 [Kitasatospora sp. NPDC051853]|uniref:hypothetical protein n=1 Tax=Kitasatospora sp. NPDC051853 TaxID=3364058 RepID=UPI0037ADF581
MARRRRARRLGAGSLTDRLHALVAADNPDQEHVLDVLSDHPEADRLFSHDARLWLDDAGRYRHLRPDDAVYSRYRLLILEQARAATITDWAALIVPAARLVADGWARALPALYDEEHRTFDHGPWRWN